MTITKKKIVIIVAVAVVLASVGFWATNRPAKEGTTKVINALYAQRTAASLLQEAEAVIVGTVNAVKARRVADSANPGERIIMSDVTIHVEEYLYNPKTLTDTDLVVEFMGGKIGNNETRVEDEQVPVAGQRLVLAIKQLGDGYALAGGAYGKFAIDQDGSLGVGPEKAFVKMLFGRNIMFSELKDALRKAAK